MKAGKRVTAVCVFGLGVVMVAGGCDKTRVKPEPAGSVPAGTEAGICILTLGEVDSGLADAVQKWARNNVAPFPPLRRAAAKLPAGSKPEDVLKAVKGIVSAKDACTLVLLQGAADRSPTDAVAAMEGVGIVYLSALQIKGKGLDHPAYRRRVQKESIRAIGSALGLAACAMPRCAMCAAQTEADLDRTGTNFCPPCYDRAEKKVQDALAR